MAYASVFVPGLFAGKVVIVTGGGSGIGRCVAHELAALGASVALVGRKLEKLETVAQEISHDGGQASAHACDIRQEEAVRQTITSIKTHHGQIDGLVNNAGGQYMQANADVGIDLISVIQALIIIFVAAPALISAIYRVKSNASATQISQGWGS